MKHHSVPVLVLLAMTLASRVFSATLFVNASNAVPSAPFNSWASAATTIQAAIDTAAPGDLILVTNGLYRAGGAIVPAAGTFSNRVAITKAVTVQSVGGPATTVIEGFQIPVVTNGDAAVRCVYLVDGAKLSGFTLRGGATRISGTFFPHQAGGGAFGQSPAAVITNCVFAFNSAGFAAGGAYSTTLQNCVFVGNGSDDHGGAAYLSILTDCVLSNNWARIRGGGTYSSIASNCVIVANSATWGGGAYFTELYNCTVVGNSASFGGGGLDEGSARNSILYFNSVPGIGAVDSNYSGAITIEYTCATPMPPDGFGNITNAPAFVNLGARNLRLAPTSPCINSGLNDFSELDLDLDGNPRIAGGTVDMGAYEFVDPDSELSFAWLQRFSLPLDGSADYTDDDGDTMNNWEEWRAGTSPLDSESVLRLTGIEPGPDGMTIQWQSAAGVNYSIQRRTLSGVEEFETIESNLPGEPGTTTYLDTTAPEAASIYRIVVD